MFMPNQASRLSGMRVNNQMKPEFCIQVSEPAGIFPIRVPEVDCRVIGSPPRAPNMATVITSGTTICIVVTPKFPSPAFMPNA